MAKTKEKKIDISEKKVYIYYSGATDITGKALAEALGYEHGREAPADKDIGLVIGWGAKVKKDIELPEGILVLNHPNNIRKNRNKYESLVAMKDKEVTVADFCLAEEVKSKLDEKNGTIKLPLVGRTKFHQGGKGFWLCLTRSQVDVAIDEGAQYFQNYIDIVDEYRLHIFRGKLLYAQKKVRRENIIEAFSEIHGEKVKAMAAKKGIDLSDETLNFALNHIGKGQEHADMIIRSNSRGWKFSHVKRSNVKKGLMEAGAAALEAIGLDFGAVDCCIVDDGTKDGRAYVIEVNSGPGLKETPFKRWCEALSDFANKVLSGKGVGSAKEALKKSVAEFASNLQALVDAAETDEEIEVVKSLWERTAVRNSN